MSTSLFLGKRYFHASFSPKNTANTKTFVGNGEIVSLDLMFGRETTKINIQNIGPSELRAPVFTPTGSSTIKIGENNVIGNIVLQVKAEATSGRLYYSLDSRSEIFAINPTSGEIMLTSKLDFRTRK